MPPRTVLLGGKFLFTFSARRTIARAVFVRHYGSSTKPPQLWLSIRIRIPAGQQCRTTVFAGFAQPLLTYSCLQFARQAIAALHLGKGRRFTLANSPDVACTAVPMFSP